MTSNNYSKTYRDLNKKINKLKKKKKKIVSHPKK